MPIPVSPRVAHPTAGEVAHSWHGRWGEYTLLIWHVGRRLSGTTRSTGDVARVWVPKLVRVREGGGAGAGAGWVWVRVWV